MDVSTRPYEVDYTDLDALIDALKIAVEKTNDSDHRRLLLGALLAKKNNDREIEEAAHMALEGATADDFDVTEAERAWTQ